MTDLLFPEAPPAPPPPDKWKRWPKEGLAIKTVDPGKKGRVILSGHYLDRVFFRVVTEKHYMRIKRAYGIQADTLQKLEFFGCETLVFRNPFADFKISLADALAYPVESFGHGGQHFIPLAEMVAI